MTMTASTSLPWLPRTLSASGALLAAAAVALSAYAAHASDGDARSGLQTAAVFAFGHGVALAALGRQAWRRLTRVALCGLLLGTLLFAGAIVLSRLAGVQIGTAPVGGSLMIVAWLVYAIDSLRR